MTYRIELTAESKKQISKLPKNVQQRIKGALRRCRIRPHAHIIRLVGSDYYRLRVGDYRIILRIIQQKLVILVIKAGHRKNIYN